jgi:hypothetical protein
MKMSVNLLAAMESGFMQSFLCLTIFIPPVS